MMDGGQAKSEYIQNIGKLFAIFVFGLLALMTVLSIMQRLGTSSIAISLTIVAIGVAIFLLTGLAARTKRADDYFSAGHEVPAFYNGMATAAAWLPLTAFLSLCGTLYSMGFDGLAWLIGAMGGIAIMGLLIVPGLYRSSAVTVPDYFRSRYGATAGLTAAVIVIASASALLAAQFSAVGLLAERFTSVAPAQAIGGAAAFTALMILFGGLRSVTWTQALQYVFILSALGAPAVLLSIQNFTLPLPVLTYGSAIEQISGLEVQMIEKGVADAGSLRPHVTPFSQLDPLNFFALVFTLMAGTACLPQLLMRHLTVESTTAARTSVAWSAFFALLLALLLPACAAFTKLSIYSEIARGVPVTQAPSWFALGSQAGLIEIHGVSAKTLKDVAAELRSGAATVSAIEASLERRSPQAAAAFKLQSPGVKDALVEAARPLGDVTDAAYWIAYRERVLPAAAAAQGNDSGMLQTGAISLHPFAIAFVLADMTRHAPIVCGLAIAGLIAAFLAAASGAMMAVSHALSHDIYHRLLDQNAVNGRRLAAGRLTVLLTAAGTAMAAIRFQGDVIQLAEWAIVLAAAGLFPVLVLGIWWRRANAWGAMAGMIVGLSLAIYLFVAARHDPVGFFETWAWMSTTDAETLAAFKDLKQNWLDAPAESKEEAWRALTAIVGGVDGAPGLANWFGITGIGATCFAIFAGFISAALVSLVSPAPQRELVNSQARA